GPDAADRGGPPLGRTGDGGPPTARENSRRDPPSAAAASGLVEPERRYALDALLDALGRPFDETVRVPDEQLDEVFGLLTLAHERDAEIDQHVPPLPGQPACTQ